MLAPAVLVMLVLFGGAMAGAVRTSVTPLGGHAGAGAWSTLLHDSEFHDAVAFTLRTAVLSTGLAALLAVLVALAARRSGTVVRALLAAPVPVPHLLVATVAVLWLAPGGLAERILGGLPFDVVHDRAGAGVVLVYIYKEVPFLVVLLLSAMGQGYRERDEAAAAVGVSPAQRLRWVLWPTIRGPLVVGCIVVFAYVAGAFEVPLALGPSYPPTVAEYALQRSDADLISGPSVAAAALLVSAAASIVLAALAVRAAKDPQGG
ncbi:ABC transporter permease subunit [Paraconexibacter antarcticus]|uniref:ABC transporter permease subunit n=1 Tax=Paraconexibacter antarcticus TaxID=2949664 RepID=A0ABY5DQN7_9ACTN|nr:ABC transporter permease subunit [Paraconexibacter antarcticus]UTI64340.1 ABC transporter permease subunit [Paraconexibacter antarcticus]